MKTAYIYDTKEIMNRAWTIKKANAENTLITFSIALKMAWGEAKRAMAEAIKEERAALEEEKEPANIALYFNGANLVINVATGIISGETYMVAKYLRRKDCEYNAKYKVWKTDDVEYFVEKYAA